MLKDFRDFLLRGNVIELATAVVIGVAFTDLVNSVVTGLIQPVIDLLGPGDVGLKYEVSESVVFDFGLVISALISFVVTAAVVFFGFVKPFQGLAARMAAKPDQPAKPDDVALLEDIRDLLRARNGSV